MKRATPALIVLALALLPLLGMESRVYLTLTVAGLAMGMLIFLVASGLTLIFGLMDVLNFAHGALFSWGAYAGFSTVLLLNRHAGWIVSTSVWLNALALLVAVAAAVLVALALGVILEQIGRASCRERV